MMFCPMIKGECRDDCAWFIEKYEIDDDGVARWEECSVSAMLTVLCELSEIMGADDEG